jgi:hypothetical protein
MYIGFEPEEVKIYKRKEDEIITVTADFIGNENQRSNDYDRKG